MAGGVMMMTFDFTSVLAHRLSDFVTFKRLGGADYGSQVTLLKDFDRELSAELHESNTAIVVTSFKPKEGGIPWQKEISAIYAPKSRQPVID
jgi:hypothetical protein